MNKRFKEVRELVSREFDGDFLVEHSGKHIRITLTMGQASRMLFTGLTPSDRRSHHKFRRDVRRVVFELEQESCASCSLIR